MQDSDADKLLGEKKLINRINNLGKIDCNRNN